MTATSSPATVRQIEQRLRTLEHDLVEARLAVAKLEERAQLAERSAHDAWSFARQLAPGHA